MTRTLARIALVATLLAAAVAPALAQTPSPGGGPAVLRALVAADPAVSPENRALARRTRGPGGVAADRASVGDLTGDGSPDLVVPVDSGGPAGVVAWFVYARVDGDLVDVLAMNDTYRARVRIAGALLVETVPVYGPTDRECCPARARTATFRWDGDGLELVRSRVTPAPARVGEP